MVTHLYVFLQTPFESGGLTGPRFLLIESEIPHYRLNSVPAARFHVARHEPEGWELYAPNGTADHHGIPHGQFLGHYKGRHFSERIRPSRAFLPFALTGQYPGEFCNVSDFPGNPRLDRLNFSEVGDELTLSRLYAYGPKPETIHFKCISGEATTKLPLSDRPKVDVAKLSSNHFTR